MKHLYPIWAFLFLCLLTPSGPILAQGSIDYEFTGESGEVYAGQLQPGGQWDGKNEYFDYRPDYHVNLRWMGQEWMIEAELMGQDGRYQFVPIAASNMDIGPNPPDLASGQWHSWSSHTLTRLDGEGTAKPTQKPIEYAYTTDTGGEHSGTLQYYTTYNGKNEYGEQTDEYEVFIYWDGSTWNIIHMSSSSYGIVATSSMDVGADPPDLASGSWQSAPGHTLTKFITGGTTEASPLALYLQVDQHVLCKGNTTGQLSGTVSNGTAPYTFAYLVNGMPVGSGTSNNATNSLSGLPAGTYEVSVTDAASQTAFATITINEPAEVLEVEPTEKVDVACFDDAAGVAAAVGTGGTSPYTYLWSTGATSSRISGLEKGTYTVTVTDANNCEAMRNFTIKGPLNPLSASASTTDVSCHGGSDGKVVSEVRGGTGPYNYAWPAGETTSEVSNLTTGTYEVTVTDANGCTTTASATVNEPAEALSATAVATNVSCNGGTDGGVDLTVTGGTAPYTYVWNNSATTEDMTGLKAGTYEVTVTDANGCTATGSATVTEPTMLMTAVSTTNVSCNGGTDGSVDLTVTGGTAPYTYVWNNSATTEDMTGLMAGTYEVTVTDANGCTATGSATVTEPTMLMTAVSTTNVSCNGGTDGSVDLTVTGGTAPYTYVWNNSATTEDMTGLKAGTYEVTVTDANGCTATGSATVTEPTMLMTAVSTTNVSCNGGTDGSVDLTVTGGTAPYTYVWNNSATTEDMTGLKAGTYEVTVTDAKGCTATGSATVTEPTMLMTAVSTTNVSCNGGTDGSVDLTVTGGTAPYTYVWNN